MSNLLRRHHQQSEDTRGTDLPESSLSKVINSPDSGEMPTMMHLKMSKRGYGSLHACDYTFSCSYINSLKLMIQQLKYTLNGN